MTDLSTVSNIEATDISPEEQYYIRIANLLLRVAPTAVRVKFDKEFYPGELRTVLNLNRFKILAPLKQKRVINQPQWDLLFPISCKPASDNFDLTLMICLIKNLTNIEVGDELPFSRNETDGADLTRIKYYRNKIMHSNDGIVSESTFKSWWDEISRAIIRLGGTSFEDRCSLMKLRKLDSNDKEVLTGIKNIIGTPDPVPKGLRQLWNATIIEWENENVAKTRAISQLTDMITKGNVAVAVGPSGCGKSTAIHYIALQLSRTKEYEIIIPNNPDDMRHFFNPDCKQVFVIDDVFGDATFDENKGKQWVDKNMLSDIKQILNSNRVKLLASCKTHIFQHRLVESIEVLSKFSFDFLSKDYCLTENERESIATFYLTKDEIQLLKSSNVLFKFDVFPVLCQHYCSRTLGNIQIVDFFSNPFQAVNTELNLLMKAYDQTTFATLFLFVIFNNSIAESLFIEKLKIKPLLENVADYFALSNFSIQFVKNNMEKLKNSYLKKQNAIYTILHDTIFDILVLFCGKHMIDFTLEVAHTNLIRDRFVLKRLMKKKVKHEKVVGIPLAMEKRYIDRLKKDIEQGCVINVFLNQNLKHPSFRCEFIKQIAEDIVISLSDKTIFSLVMSMMDCGFCDIVAILLIKEIDLNKLNWDGETPLFKATCKGYTKVVQVMLDQKADPNFHACFNWIGHIEKLFPWTNVNSTNVHPFLLYSPLPFSTRQLDNNIEEGHTSCSFPLQCWYNRKGEKYVRTGISWIKVNPVKSPSSVERSEPYKLSPLHIDNSWLKNLPVERVRLSPFQRYGTYNVSPLHIATSKGYTDIVKLLLSYDADLDYATECNQIESSLYTASIQGYTDIVHLLLENKSNSNVKISKYSMSVIRNSLFVAVEKGYCDIVKLLLDHYVNLFKQKDQIRMTPHTNWLSFYLKMIEIAVVNDRDNIVKLLIEKDCDSNISFSNFSDETKTSVLFNSICKGKTKIVKLLLEHNIDPNLCIKNNESPLLRATDLGFIDIIKLLLEHKSNPNISNTENISPLHIASWNGHTGIVRLLLKHNSDSEIYDNKKQHALYVAALNGHTDIVKLLLDNNSNANLCNNDNETPLFAASTKGYTDIVKLLLDHNCDPNICNKDNKSPLFKASLFGCSDVVRLLIDHNCDPNICSNDNESALFAASSKGHTEVVKLLLDYNCDPNICNKDNKSSLFVACDLSWKDTTEIVELLLDHNCDPNTLNKDDESPLFVACSSCLDNTKIIKLLLDHKADPKLCNKDNKSPLFMASRSNRANIVKLLLDHNCDPNICSNDNESALFAASSMGHTAVVKLLLYHNCDPNIFNKDNKSSLFKASLSGCSEIVRLLLDHNSDPNICSNDNESALFAAASKGHTEVVKLLLDYNCDPNICNKDNKSPLFVACDLSLKDTTEIVELLLDHNCDPNTRNIDNESPLFVACGSCKDNAKIIKLLLDHKCNPNLCNKDNESPLFRASRSNRANIVKLLLDHNCDPNICNKDNKSPLFIASSKNNAEIVKYLIDHNCEPHICCNKNESPLFVASSKGHTEVVKLLLEHNSDPNVCYIEKQSSLSVALKLLDSMICNTESKSPLFVAVYNGHVEVVKLLLSHNCDANICNAESKSPLFVAAYNGHVEVVKLLLSHNCDANICNTESKSPLFVASCNGHTAVVELLLNYNCDPNICNKDNKSPLFVASDKGYSEIVKLLLNHYCDPNQYTSSHETPLFVASKSQGYKSRMRYYYRIRRNNSTASAKFMISESYTEIVKLLLSHNADPNVCNENNESPLFAASSNGNIDIVKLLLDHIVYPFICNKDNESPLQVATRRNHTEIVDLLNKYETAKCKYSS